MRLQKKMGLAMLISSAMYYKNSVHHEDYQEEFPDEPVSLGDYASDYMMTKEE